MILSKLKTRHIRQKIIFPLICEIYWLLKILGSYDDSYTFNRLSLLRRIPLHKIGKSLDNVLHINIQICFKWTTKWLSGNLGSLVVKPSARDRVGGCSGNSTEFFQRAFLRENLMSFAHFAMICPALRGNQLSSLERDSDVYCCHMSSCDSYYENDLQSMLGLPWECVIWLGKATLFVQNVIREQSNTDYNPELKYEVYNSKGVGMVLNYRYPLGFFRFLFRWFQFNFWWG